MKQDKFLGLKTNMTTSPMQVVITKLINKQQQAVRDIGFRSLLSLRLTKLSKILALYLVQKFNVHNTSLTPERETVHIEKT